MDQRPVLQVSRTLRKHAAAAVGGDERLRAVVVLASVLGLSGADLATVGASATQLRHALGISDTDIGLLIAVPSLVGAMASLPFGVLADRTRRTSILGIAIAFWAGAMIWSATVSSFGGLLLARLALGAVTAAAGPMVASLVGDYFPASERGRIYGFILAGELVGTGFGFAVTGDVATLSWRAAFVVLSLPALVLSVAVFRLPEPERGQAGSLGPGTRPSGDAGPTDAQRLAAERGIEADPSLAVEEVGEMSLLKAVGHVLRVRTNLILIAASACGYYFLAGVQVFGIEFAKKEYGVDQIGANLLMLGVGVGAVFGVLAGGSIGDALVRRGILSGRIFVSAVAAAVTTALFIPAILTRDLLTALPYLAGAGFMLSAQNPALDAARLDIMPPELWGRAESIRTLLRSVAQALAPALFGLVADHVFGGGRAGLRWTFVAMLVPLAGSSALLFAALRSYPRDVASAAAAPRQGRRSTGFS